MTAVALLIFAYTNARTQVVVHSRLGRTIQLAADGSATISENKTQEQTNSPFEKPKPIQEIDQAYKTKITQLETYCFQRDTSLALDLYLTQKRLSELKTQAGKSVSESAAVQQKINFLNASYNRLENFCNEVSKLKNENSEKKLVSQIDLLHDDIFNTGTTVESKSEGPSVVFTTPQIDERMPWEIVSPDDTTSLSLLTYTPERLKNYYKGNYLLEVFPRLIDKKWLELKFVFHSNDIVKSYGSIERGAMLRLDFIHGKAIVLKSYKSAEGTLEAYTGNTVYTSVYEIKTKDEYKRLLGISLDNIGVMWSSGFETYPVYQIDYFKTL